MKNKSFLQEFDDERNIIHKLLLYSGLMSEIGLLRGKMGLVIFFMYYHQLTNESLYEDTADELMDEVIEELHKNLPVTFGSGLSGIGWGIDYLIQKGFIEGDSKEVCEEIDKRIMETDPRRMEDYSLESGFGGILFYVLAHSKIVFDQRKTLPFDDLYLHDLYVACTNVNPDIALPTETMRLIEIYISFYERKTIPDDCVWDLSILIQGIQEFDSKSLPSYALGIREGLASFLFKKYDLQNNKIL